MSRTAGNLFAATLLVAAAAEALAAEHRERPLTLPPIEATGLVAVRLDGDVHAAAADDYGDLRIVDGQGVEVPYVVRDVATTDRGIEERLGRAIISEAQPRPDGSLEVTVTLGDTLGRVRPAGFRLLTRLHDFEHRVTVAWSADGSDWMTLVEDALVYDYSRFVDVRDLSVVLPAAPDVRPGGRYRLVIGDVTQEQQSRLSELTRTLAAGVERKVEEKTVVERRPFRLDGIEFWYTAEVEKSARPVLEDRATGGLRVTREPGGRATRITVDARRQPVTEFGIVTDSRNFSRSLTVERPVEPDRDGRLRRGRPIASTTITRIDVAGLRREQLAIPLPESRLEAYDLVIDDGDSPPLAVAGVTARGPAREAVFLAEPGGAYRLAYGGDRAAPRYDTAAIRAAVAARVTATPATLGAESIVATPPAPAAADPLGLLRDGRFQIAVIAALAIVLAVALFRAAKRIDAAPPPTE
jgi:hypothetical protein